MIHKIAQHCRFSDRPVMLLFITQNPKIFKHDNVSSIISINVYKIIQKAYIQITL